MRRTSLEDFLSARIAEDVPHPERQAKQRILDAYCEARDAAMTYIRIDWAFDPARGERERATSQARWHALGEAVFALAAIYEDHSDYDESWRP